MRLLLAALAYTLIIHLRRLAPHGAKLERACTAPIRTKLLKIGAALARNTRRVRVHGVAPSAAARVLHRRALAP